MDKTVAKAFAVLELLVKAGHPCGVTELALAAGLQKSNVHRLLSTLVRLGYVKRTDAARYQPSLRVWELGQRVYAGINIVRVARPHMRRLVDRTDETAHLAAFDGTEVVYLDKVESPNPVRAYTAVGGRAPAYCTASGKALLASRPQTVVEAVAREFVSFTPSTINNIAALCAELALVRRRGFATNVGEFRANVAGLAAPIRNGEGETVAAIGIAGPLDRLRPRKLKALAPTVMEAAVAISAELGAPPEAGGGLQLGQHRLEETL